MRWRRIGWIWKRRRYWPPWRIRRSGLLFPSPLNLAPNGDAKGGDWGSEPVPVLSHRLLASVRTRFNPVRISLRLMNQSNFIDIYTWKDSFIDIFDLFIYSLLFEETILIFFIYWLFTVSARNWWFKLPFESDAHYWKCGNNTYQKKLILFAQKLNFTFRFFFIILEFHLIKMILYCECWICHFEQ